MKGNPLIKTLKQSIAILISVALLSIQLQATQSNINVQSLNDTHYHSTYEVDQHGLTQTMTTQWTHIETPNGVEIDIANNNMTLNGNDISKALFHGQLLSQLSPDATKEETEAFQAKLNNVIGDALNLAKNPDGSYNLAMLEVNATTAVNESFYDQQTSISALGQLVIAIVMTALTGAGHLMRFILKLLTV